MLKQLSSISQEGVGLYINERQATPDEIVDLHCVNEKSVYMPDYIIDSKGEVIEIRYMEIEQD